MSSSKRKISNKVVISATDMEESQTVPTSVGQAEIFSTSRPHSEDPNEDAAGLIDIDSSSAVLAVADGAGGHPGGKEAAQAAVQAILNAVEESANAGQELRNAILNGFEEANRAVGDLGTGALTTLSVVEIQGNQIRPYHVGDSMILALGQRGKIKLQTVSHSPVGYAVESGLIEEEEALSQLDKYSVLNMVGASDMRIELGPTFELSQRDTLLVASDGLSDNLSIGEIAEVIRKGDLSTATSSLAEQCIVRMEDDDEDSWSKPDDLTMIAFRMN